MNDLVRSFDKLPWIIRLICALPGLDGIVYGIYRILKGHIIAGIIWLICGIALLWIVDLLSVLFSGKVTVFAQ